MKNNGNIKRTVIWLIVISALIRSFIAAILELGNDEVYYWCYALFPSLSHFDHPPMIGLIIQTLTANLALSDEFFIRSASIIIGSLNTWMIYVLGRKIKNEMTGMYAAFLYTASIYCSIIVGTFIMPDTPQSLFFLLSLYFLHEYAMVPEDEKDREKINLGNHALILAGLFIGLAMFSKYSSAYLWGGLGLYLLLYKRKGFLNPYLYLSGLISIVILLPVIVWNVQNDWISFTFHGNRVSHFEGLKLFYFGREIAGAILYNNPVNIIIIIAALAGYRRHKYLKKEQMRFFLLMSLPMIAIFLFISLFKETLPHWSSPAYFSLMLIAASYIADKVERGAYRNIAGKSGKMDTVHYIPASAHYNEKLKEKEVESVKKGESVFIPASIQAALITIAAITAIGVFFINTGIPNVLPEDEPEKLGKSDFTLDMYGWKQLSEKFSEIRLDDIRHGKMPESAYILAGNWFPAAHLDYYVASPNKMVVKTIGKLENTHKYAWITVKRGGINLGDNAYLILSSRYHYDSLDFFSQFFETTEFVKTINITRNGKDVVRFKVYRCKNLDNLPEHNLRAVPLIPEQSGR